jgi:imidazolonepropionase-like amidohydrolase
MIAIVGATVIDGNGGAPLQDGTILVEGSRISAVGPRSSVRVPSDARVIDGTGRYVTPGFIDTNVHLNLSFGRRWSETNARYWRRNAGVTLQAAQLHLKHGITTVRDSYGALLPGIEVRDAIARGDAVGPRMYVAGNIVGWGGPFSVTFSGDRESDLTLFEEQINDSITLGSGEELMHMTPEELRVAMNAYLDLGPDFIKYGGTSHFNYPTLIGFSPRAQRVIVEETQKRGLVAEIHSTTLEGLRLSILAGVDLIQHPEVTAMREITDELVEMIVERGVICSLLPNKYTGEVWKLHLEERERAAERWAKLEKERRTPLTEAEVRRKVQETGIPDPRSVTIGNLEMRQMNGRKLIEGGCIVSVGPDNLLFGSGGVAPEFMREKRPAAEHLEPGIGTIIAIEGLVELGMTPSEAIVAATKHGAMACKALDEFGTLEAGKLADVLVLGADPLEDISNIRQLDIVIMEGAVIDIESLPTNPVTGEW